MAITYRKPRQSKFLLEKSSPVVTNLVIELLAKSGIPVYDETLKNGYDEGYPYLGWFCDELTQYKDSKGELVLSLEDFMKQFTVKTTATFNLTPDYSNVTVYADKVKVGCQTITKEKIKELLAVMEGLDSEEEKKEEK